MYLYISVYIYKYIHVYVCVYICIYVRMCRFTVFENPEVMATSPNIYAHTHVYVYIHRYTCISRQEAPNFMCVNPLFLGTLKQWPPAPIYMHEYIYICMLIYIYICTYVQIHIFFKPWSNGHQPLHIHIYIYICMYIYIYMYVYADFLFSE